VIEEIHLCRFLQGLPGCLANSCRCHRSSISPADKIADTSQDEIPLNSMWLSKERGGTGSLLIGDGIVVTVCGEELASAFGEFDLSSLLNYYYSQKLKMISFVTHCAAKERTE